MGRNCCDKQRHDQSLCGDGMATVEMIWQTTQGNEIERTQKMVGG